MAMLDRSLSPADNEQSRCRPIGQWLLSDQVSREVVVVEVGIGHRLYGTVENEVVLACDADVSVGVAHAPAAGEPARR